MRLEHETCEETPEGGPLERFALEADTGLRVELLSQGATLSRVRAPDREGRLGDVVLGFDDPRRYRGPHPHLGGVVGRYANRIAGGRFRLDGREVVLSLNAPPHHLHGGAHGFDRANWRAEARRSTGELAVCFAHVSPDGDQGYPGRLEAAATYRLHPHGELVLELEARCDAPTVVNLTNHAYFNLRDGGASPVLDHVLEIPARRYTPVDPQGLPSGDVASVRGTPLDFRLPRRLGERLGDLRDGRAGYDHNYVLDATGAPDLRLAARLWEPVSGRRLELLTTQPGLQLYSGNHLDGTVVGRGGVAYGRFHGLCLETQHFPDSPNRPLFPSTRLDPGARYAQRTVFRFDVAG